MRIQLTVSELALVALGSFTAGFYCANAMLFLARSRSRFGSFLVLLLVLAIAAALFLTAYFGERTVVYPGI